jgi:hypothetical protein
MNEPTLNIEHEIQRQMLQRLGIEWTPGEPFYALVEDEISRLRTELHRVAESRRGQRERAQRAEAENEQLRAALVQIENWSGRLPSNLGEAALVFGYITQACQQALGDA